MQDNPTSSSRAGCDHDHTAPPILKHAIRVAVSFDVAAVADRYEQDVAPESGQERHAGILEAVDHIAISDHTDLRYALLELAGRTLAWLEHDATEQAQ